MRTWLLLLAVVLCGVAVACWADAEGEVRALHPSDVEWSPTAFACAQVALVAGQPAKGMHYTFLKMSDGCRIPPHWHSTDESFTVVAGTAWLGVGTTFDAAQARAYGPGSCVFIPAGTRHYAWAEGECILSQTRSGAVDFFWVNPDDDPARKRK